MKIKDFFNKTSIRNFCHFQSIFNQLRIDKSRENKVVNLIQGRFLYCKKHALYCWLLLITLLISLPSFAAPRVPHLRLVIGQYECSSNGDCVDGYCDIDEHVCKIYPASPDSPTLPECAAGQHQVDGVCVECISNAECTDSSKPRCDMGSFTCSACPGDKPFWNGSECESCPAGTILDGGVCSCPSDKPYRLTACIGCEGNKIFVPERNACECPSDLPNWDASAKVCSAACTDGYLWNGTHCVECLSNDDCDDSSLPMCNSSNACAACPASTPYWNTSTKKCESCPTETPYWDAETKQCERCPSGLLWDTETNQCIECMSNSDCPLAEKGYCNLETKQCEICRGRCFNIPISFRFEEEPVPESSSGSEPECVPLNYYVYYNSRYSNEKLTEGTYQVYVFNKNGLLEWLHSDPIPINEEIQVPVPAGDWHIMFIYNTPEQRNRAEFDAQPGKTREEEIGLPADYWGALYKSNTHGFGLLHVSFP